MTRRSVTTYPACGAVIRSLLGDYPIAPLAVRIRVTRQAVYAWRDGTRRPSHECAADLLDALNATAEQRAALWQAMGVRGVA